MGFAAARPIDPLHPPDLNVLWRTRPESPSALTERRTIQAWLSGSAAGRRCCSHNQSTASKATSISAIADQLSGIQPRRSCRKPARKLAVAVVPNTRKSFSACALPRSDGR